jgi:hypothetical protein
MSFVLGFVFGVAVNIVLILILLGVSKALGFTMMLRNEWRKENGGFGYQTYGGRHTRIDPYGCRDCYYKRYYEHPPKVTLHDSGNAMHQEETEDEEGYESLLEEDGSKEFSE